MSIQREVQCKAYRLAKELEQCVPGVSWLNMSPETLRMAVKFVQVGHQTERCMTRFIEFRKAYDSALVPVEVSGATLPLVQVEFDSGPIVAEGGE